MNALIPSPSPRPPLTALISLVLDALPSANSKRSYAIALGNFLEWCAQNRTPFTKATVQRYRSELEARALAASTINLHLAAIRRLAIEAADNQLLDRDISESIQRVKGQKR